MDFLNMVDGILMDWWRKLKLYFDILVGLIFVFVDCKNQLIKEIRKSSAANIVLLKCVAERLRLEIYTRFDQRSSIES